MYKLTFKRKWQIKAKVIEKVISHSYVHNQDKLIVFTTTGAKEIIEWSKCSLTLGEDWKAEFDESEKRRIEAQAKG